MKPPHITGLLLAGGQGSRMGGVDKGLQLLRGQPLAQHALARLAPQVGPLLISANRHLAEWHALAAPYAAPVLSDRLSDAAQGYAGPLAGFLAGLEHCQTPWLLSVPCDSPRFPPDLARRLWAAAQAVGAPLAMACAPDAGALRRQPVFCLIAQRLLPSLQQYTAQGGRKIGAWAAAQDCALAAFDQPGDDPQAFANANTLDDLAALEQRAP